MEQLTSILSGNWQFSSQVGSGRSTCKHFTGIPAVQLHRFGLVTVVTGPSRHSQASLNLGYSQPERPGEALSCAFLREAKINKDVRPTSIAQLAVPASQALSPSLHGVLFIPSKHHMSSTCLDSALVLPQHVHRISLSPSRQMELNYTL